MHRRAVIVLLLASLVFTAQIAAIHALVTVNSEVTASGWDWDTLHDGSFVVAAIYELDADGHRTPAAQAGLHVGDRVVAIYSARGEGGPLASLGDVSSADRTIHRGEPWEIGLGRPADDHAFVAALLFVCFASIGLDPLGLDLPTVVTR